jgi:hypothetical protein
MIQIHLYICVCSTTDLPKEAIVLLDTGKDKDKDKGEGKFVPALN